MKRGQSTEQLERNVVAVVGAVELVRLAEHIVTVRTFDVQDRLQVSEKLWPEGA